LEICKYGLRYEPRNSTLSNLKGQIEDAIARKEDPKAYSKKKFEEKGWKVSSK